MATEVIKIVDPDNGSGTNYTSLSAWEAGEQGDLTGARDEIAVAKCRCTGGTADTTNVTIDGWTTSSTQYIKIWTDPSESYRHNGTWQTGNKYRIVSSASWGQGTLRIAEQYVRIIGLQIDNTAEHQANGIVLDTSVQSTSSYLLISHNIVRLSGGGGTSSHHGINNIGGLNSYVINNIVYGWEYGINIGYSEVAVNICIYNNTIVNCSSSCVVNYSYSGANVRLYNNIAQGTSSEGNYDYVVGPDASGSNISSDTTSPNAAYRSKTVTFVGSGNYHLSSSDTEARSNGTNLYNDSYYAFQDDIDGDDRGGSWDIGADEYVAAASSTRVPFRRMNVLLRLCLSVLTLFGRLFR